MPLVKSAGKKGEKSRQTRQRITQAAYDLFVEQGYGATTLQRIAERAGVAVQTIYFAFGNKPSLLKEVVDVAIAGDDEPIPTLQRAWFRDALAADTAEAHLRAHVHGTCQVLRRVAPIMDVLRGAGEQDPSIAGLWPQDVDPRIVVQTTAARSLMGKPGAHTGLSEQDAADVLYGILSPELYLLFVRERGWTPDRWEAWAYDTLRTHLLA
ncbi:TetR/AcrR family transcriptional regulator [Virgisporangium aurantiacum]|uniref:TetR family transcriptional regulator n=1 Tax=Virgisporangium aurantiacum TaxID=175570 RepID=A0A8J3ZB34_9ACTN|nr:TetR/AcrR family transcriptional regulator [Virgisporangium aurantiacum]GIJ58500.1 TetR family transcriptional regulator [Virgisporangium aurantiacum]